ncbi:retention module-containing protein [Nitrincola sp.]|uniref:retention module-containing protein n=1 Tax=Nitrincola sp. TaxID=1926584 RepID=UPI003A8F52FF
MSPQVAIIVSVSGDVSARAEDGTIRVLSPGDALYAGEVLISADGSQVVLDYDKGELVSLNGPQNLLLTENQITASAPEPVESEITDPSVDSILAALEGDGDLLDDLEAPAAGAEGAPDGGGGSFVRLMRISESVDPLVFQFEQQLVSDFEAPLGDGGIVAAAEDPVPPVINPEGGEVNETGGFDSFTQSLGVNFGGLTGTIALSAPGAVWDSGNNTLTYGPDSYGGSWQIQVNPDGTYTFEQLSAVEHPDDADPNDPVGVEVTVTATSENGLSTSATFDVTIFDDGPSILDLNIDPEGLNLMVYDAQTLGEGGSEDKAALSDLFSASIDYGADGPGAAEWSYALGLVVGENDQFPPMQTPGEGLNDFPPEFNPIVLPPVGVFSGLLNGGQPIFLELSDDLQSITGSLYGQQGSEIVFTLEIQEGELVLTQLLPIDHLLYGEPVNQLNLANLVTLTGSVTVTDRDGDSVSQSTEPFNLGEFITFNDDEPTAQLGGETEAIEGGAEVTGTWSTDPGADEQGAERQVSINGATPVPLVTGEPIDTGVGILTFNANGTWSFVAATNLDHSGNDNPALSFQLIKIDGDLDEADATHTITIVDGDGPTPGGEDGVGSSVNLVTSDVDLRDNPDSNDSNTLTFTAGSDNIAGFVFGATDGISIAGLDGVLTWDVNPDGDLVGSLNGSPVIQLSLTGSEVLAGETGNVTVAVKQLASLPHNVGVDELDITGVEVKAIDSDGTESATASVSVKVYDDLPEVSGTDPSGHEVTITNLGSDTGTGYNNSFGYYVVGENGEPTVGAVLWSNVKLDVNDIRIITGYAPGEIGYFIIPNGANHNGDLTNDTPVVFQSFVNGNGDTVWQAWTADENGDPLEPLLGQNSNMPALFSDGDLHPNGTSHVENNLTEGDLNWEDIYGNSSDYDFNDVNINVAWSDANLTVSESDLDQVANFDFSTHFVAEFGADEQGTPSAYTLGVTQGDGSDSGLVDTLTGETVLLRMVGNDVQGYVMIGGFETPVFTVTVNSETGVVTLDQLRAVEHPLAGVVGDSDVVNIAAGAIDLTKTVSDSDNDIDDATIDIGPVMYFQDAGPSAENFTYETPVAVGVSDYVLAADAIASLGIDAGPDGYLNGSLQDAVQFEVGSLGGSLAINAAGELIYNPPGDLAENAQETFNYKVFDGDGDTVERTVSVGLVENTPPVADPVLTQANVVFGSLPAGLPDDAVFAKQFSVGGGVDLDEAGQAVPSMLELDASLGGQDQETLESDLVFQITDLPTYGTLYLNTGSGYVPFDASDLANHTFTVDADLYWVATAGEVQSAMSDQPVLTLSGNSVSDWQAHGVSIHGYTMDGQSDASTLRFTSEGVGVDGSSFGQGEVPNQLGYRDGSSETIILDFTNPVGEAEIAVSRLIFNEKEVGRVEAFLNGTSVGSWTFTGSSATSLLSGETIDFTPSSGFDTSKGTGSGSGAFTLSGVVFDQLRFSATEYGEGGNANTSDSSDYFLQSVSFKEVPSAEFQYQVTDEAGNASDPVIVQIDTQTDTPVPDSVPSDWTDNNPPSDIILDVSAHNSGNGQGQGNSGTYANQGQGGRLDNDAMTKGPHTVTLSTEGFLAVDHKGNDDPAMIEQPEALLLQFKEALNSIRFEVQGELGDSATFSLFDAAGNRIGDPADIELQEDGTLVFESADPFSYLAIDGSQDSSFAIKPMGYSYTNTDGDIVGSSGDDYLFATDGDDVLIGGAGADTFKWSLSTQGGDDVVMDFNASEGDVVDIADLLQGEEGGNLTDYISVTESVQGTLIELTPMGDGSSATQSIMLDGVSFADLGIDTSTMTTDEAIINHLVDSGHINIDQ